MLLGMSTLMLNESLRWLTSVAGRLSLLAMLCVSGGLVTIVGGIVDMLGSGSGWCSCDGSQLYEDGGSCFGRMVGRGCHVVLPPPIMVGLIVFG